MTIDQEAYVKSGGVRCPYCGADNLLGHRHLSDDASGVTREITCQQCGHSWYDEYTLTGIILDETQAPDEEEQPQAR